MQETSSGGIKDEGRLRISSYWRAILGWTQCPTLKLAVALVKRVKRKRRENQNVKNATAVIIFE